MDKEGTNLRFGQIAVRKGYITSAQLLEAMNRQIEEDLLSKPHRVLGDILIEMDAMGREEVEDVLKRQGLDVSIQKG